MGVKKSVFAVTNFGTRVVVPVSVHCTAGHFKKEFESVHLEIYPEHGKLRVDSLKVKRESFFYHLCDSVPVELVLRGEDRSLHVEASKSAPLGVKETSFDEKEEEEMSSFLEASKSSSLSQEEKGFRTSIDDEQGINDANLEGLSDPVSKTISVTGIINKYFSTGDDEVNSYSKSPLVTLFPVVPQTHQLHEEHMMTNVGVLVADEPKKTSVGARVMEASQSFGISSTKKSPAHHLSKLIDGGSTEAVKSARRCIKSQTQRNANASSAMIEASNGRCTSFV